ncbi:MAG: adenylosuccinate lyase [Verrucomicrobiales bacterium]|jgi:adenylosuccinate lyase
MSIPNVLAERYASPEIQNIWSAEGKIVLEREFWIAVMRAQRSAGLDISEEAIAAYEKVKDTVNVPAIMERERATRHDVKARIEEFCDLAGHEHIHKGMTSRDLTENVEQLQVYRSLLVIRQKAATVLHLLGQRAVENQAIGITARTHNVAAQLSTLGRRIAMFAEETLDSFEALDSVVSRYAVRGLKGAVGTQLDQLSLFDGGADTVRAVENSVLEHLGIPRRFEACGQVYPRSQDFRVVSALCDLASGPGSFCRTLRLMAGHETASEGFAKGQTGSSAMPHKMNSRSCERVNGFHTLLKGYVTMASGLAGDQWNEGDVSCSVVRRVVLPDSFFAIDGLLETFLTVLVQMEVFPHVIGRENTHYLPFLLSTTFLMEAVKAGVGRETAHEVVKEHAIAAVRALRDGSTNTNDFVDRLTADDRLGLSTDQLNAILEKGAKNTGAADAQTASIIERIAEVTAQYPGAKDYLPGAIL